MILGTICARRGSKGVPYKNIKLLKDRPMVLWTIDCADSCKSLDGFIVSTDDRDVVKAAEAFAPIQMRPPELCTDTASKWDVFRYIAKQNWLKPDDILVDLDIGCPLREPRDITACIDQLETTGADVVFTVYKSERNPYFNMVEAIEDGVVMAIPNYPPITRRQDAPEVWSLSPSVFAIRADALTKYNHWSMVDRMGIHVIPHERAWDVDTPLDFAIVDFLMEHK